MTDRVSSAFTVRRRAVELMGREVVMVEDLAERLGAVGVRLGGDATGRLAGLLDGCGEFVELEGGWVAAGAHLEGTAWSTIVPADDAAAGVLRVDPDLMLLGWYALDAPLGYGDVPDAVSAVELEDGADALAGPEGWLAGCADRPVAVRIDPGRLALEALAAAATPTPAQAAAIRSTFDKHAEHDELVSSLVDDPPVALVQMGLEDLLWEALVEHREAFTAGPVAGVDALLEAAGLRRRSYTVGDEHMDWAALDRWHMRNRLAGTHGLTGELVDLAELLVGASYTVTGGDADPLGPAGEELAASRLIAACLAEPRVARAFWGHHRERETPPEDLLGFARRVLTRHDGGGSAGPYWLAGRALDLAGEPLEAEAELRASVATGDEHPLALRALAAFEADRGNAPEAIALLRRAGVDEEDELVGEVGDYVRHRRRAAAGRNDPCPCGSGRKYKACHLGRERHALIDRGPWLYDKACRYLRDNRYRSTVSELARVVQGASGRSGMFLLELLDSKLVADVALCEAGVFDSFLTERHRLLPDDEALLAGRWQLVERSLFEIERVGDDRLLLRDLRTGDRITVTNTNADPRTRPGHLLCGRPLPIEDTWRAYSGFVRVGSHRIDEFLDALDGPDPYVAAGLVGSCLAPPVMQNTDGESLVFHELTFRVADPTAARDALDASDLHGSGDGTYTLVRDSANRKDTIVLTFALVGDELQVSANSDARAAEAERLVARLLPDAALVDRDLRPLEEVLEEAPGGQDDSARQSGADDPAMAEALERYVAELETRWLDEAIPALGGRTPREAAADPVGRHDLERLLKTVDGVAGAPGTMDPQRLRRALGL